MKRRRRRRSTLPEPAMAITVREGLVEERDKRRFGSKKVLLVRGRDWEVKESNLGEERRRPMESWEASDVEVTAIELNWIESKEALLLLEVGSVRKEPGDYKVQFGSAFSVWWCFRWETVTLFTTSFIYKIPHFYCLLFSYRFFHKLLLNNYGNRFQMHLTNLAGDYQKHMSLQVYFLRSISFFLNIKYPQS